MLGKTKTDVAQAGGMKLQAKNNKWYRYLLHAQLLVFAVVHFVLGMYFAFVTSEYANHPGFAATIKDHRNMDQICAIICFVLFALWLRCFLGMLKDKKISVLYYIAMAVSVVLPFVYTAMSDSYILDAMRNVLAGDAELIIDGVGNVNEITFWTGLNYGMWINSAEFTSESQLVLDYLGKLSLESGAEMELAKFDLKALLDMFRVDKYSWNKFELYAIINAVVSVAFVAGTAILVPLKKNLLTKLFKK
jgi:hypothetical protein